MVEVKRIEEGDYIRKSILEKIIYEKNYLTEHSPKLFREQISFSENIKQNKKN